MTPITSFPPIADRDARVLILGSMPGAASLRAQQYYAHPRNAFWPIMGAVCGFSAALPYALRLDKLKASRIALWDVLQSCVRPGSLDGSIESGSRVPNDFAAFFKAHAGVRQVCFNGAEAARSFKRYVLPQVEVGSIAFVALPSTSPAHAAVASEQKLAAWGKALSGPP